MIGSHKIVALCTARIHDKEVHSFIKELNKRITEEDGRLFVYNTRTEFYWDDNKINAESTVFDLINFDITDVVVIMEEKIKSKTITKKITEKAKKANIPAIIVDGTEKGCASVRFAFGKGFEKVVRHVVEDHKFRKLHFLGGFKNEFFSEERKQVFKRVIEENGITFDESMVSYGNFNALPAQQITKELIKKGDLPEAIICANDLMAFNVCCVLHEHGINVPEQVAVTGFDGIEEIHFFSPRLTSCRCSYEDMAGVTYQAIKDCFESGAQDKMYWVEPELILLDSCGCGSTSKTATSSYLNIINERFLRYQDENEILSDISEAVQSCETLEQAANQFKNSVFYSLCCMINKSYLNNTVNPFQNTQGELFEKTMCVFCDTEDHNFIPHEIQQDHIVPNLDKILSNEYPLIFNVIDFMKVPLGYVCFHFEGDDSIHYSRISQTVSALDNAIGGYINTQYQRYLAYQIEEMYKFDSLTRLYNRQGFMSQYEKLQKKTKENQGKITVVLADLDGLKKINDRYGHAAGDHAIRTLADALVHAVPNHALCVRFGGDEMVAVIEGCYNLANIRAKFDEYIREANEKGNEDFIVSASLGIYIASGIDDIDFESLIKNADKYMYEEKNRKLSLKKAKNNDK